MNPNPGAVLAAVALIASSAQAQVDTFTTRGAHWRAFWQMKLTDHGFATFDHWEDEQRLYFDRIPGPPLNNEPLDRVEILRHLKLYPSPEAACTAVAATYPWPPAPGQTRSSRVELVRYTGTTPANQLGWFAWVSLPIQDGYSVWGCYLETFQPDGTLASRSHIDINHFEPYCADGRLFTGLPGAARCVDYLELDQPESSPEEELECGNPIQPLTGAKRQTETFGVDLTGLGHTLTYDSKRQGTDLRVPRLRLPFAFGDSWVSRHHRMLRLDDSGKQARVLNPDGSTSSFVHEPAGWRALVRGDSLTTSGSGFVFKTQAGERFDTFSSTGALLTATTPTGAQLSYAYGNDPTIASPDLLSVSDAFGRSTRFSYQWWPGYSAHLVSRIVGPDGARWRLEYQETSRGLERAIEVRKIVGPDRQGRTFVYEHPAKARALTGIIDERGVRYATFGYDATGRATSTEHSGAVNRYEVTYLDAPVAAVDPDSFDPVSNTLTRATTAARVVVKNPVGTQYEVTGSVNGALPRVDHQTQPAGSGCAISFADRTRDAHGNPVVRDDFNGHRICADFDLGRDVETVRVEGLAAGTACAPLVAPAAALPAGARKISSQWHPDWKRETRRAEPRRLTYWVYNGQSDPFQGGAVAACAPAGALLPDGSPLLVLCKHVELATTDLDGALGFAATPQANVEPQATSFTYDEHGHVLTRDGPRTDVNDVTTFTYAQATSATHTRGDLLTVTDGAGRVTRYQRYDENGHVLKEVGPTGIVTDAAYDQRGRLIFHSVGGAVSRFEYTPAGQLERVRQPNLSFTHYVYDDAQRLTGWRDANGHQVDYTLDAAGRTRTTTVKTGAGAVTRESTVDFDALGRVQQTKGALP